jgi:uncharacterized protein YecE (DUF72 family)
MIWIGTSGFQYDEWKGAFYPEKLSKAKMLPYYAERFPTTEINYTFRRVPSEKTLNNWSAATPAKFKFTLKAPQEITHWKQLQNADAVLKRFCDVIKALDQKLGVILFQLPPTLKFDLTRLKNFLVLLPKNLKCAFEFRHESWLCDETYAALKSKNVALCTAETEEMSTPVIQTAKHIYFRLRRTDYKKADIQRWAKTISETGSKDIYVYFKHEETGVGPKFARQLMDALGCSPLDSYKLASDG